MVFDVPPCRPHPGHSPGCSLQHLLETIHRDPTPHILEGALIKSWQSSRGSSEPESFQTELYNPKTQAPKSQNSLPKPPRSESCLADVIWGIVCLCSSEESDLHTWNSHNGGVYREDEKIHYSDRKGYEQILFAGLHVWWESVWFLR